MYCLFCEDSFTCTCMLDVIIQPFSAFFFLQCTDVQHAILLVSPKKRLLCSAEDYSSKVALLSILEETIRAALDVD